MWQQCATTRSPAHPLLLAMQVALPLSVPHFVLPTKRPGSCFKRSFFTEKNPACGPPYPRGTPNRCEFPRHMSAPTSPGGSNTHRASKSVATATRPCRHSTLKEHARQEELCHALPLLRGSSQPRL